MLYKKGFLFVFITLFATLLPFSSNADGIKKEVIIMIQDRKILTFSAYKSHWVFESIKISERVISKKSQGNIGIVVTNKRFLAVSSG